jgi:hypothetical protein
MIDGMSHLQRAAHGARADDRPLDLGHLLDDLQRMSGAKGHFQHPEPTRDQRCGERPRRLDIIENNHRDDRRNTKHGPEGGNVLRHLCRPEAERLS